MTEEIEHGIGEVETPAVRALAKRLDQLNLQDEDERAERMQLQDRVRKLEHVLPSAMHRRHGDAEEVDKSMVVVGGVVTKPSRMPKLSSGMVMRHIGGFEDVSTINNESPLRFVRRTSPAQAMKLIRARRNE